MRDFLQAVVFIGVFLTLFIPLMVSDTMFFPFITGKNFAFRIVVDIIFAAWFILALLDTKYRLRFSWLLPTTLGFLIIIFFADLFGEYPLKSLWSNFERMDGFVMLVHFFLYFVVLAHTLRESKYWTYFFNTTLGVATYVALYGLARSSGLLEGGGGRIDSTLGNASYMAIYMLFHIFILAYLFLHTKNRLLQAVYAIGSVLFVYILLETGTRGTFIGLAVGTFVAVSYMALFGRGYPQVRKIAIGSAIIGIVAAAAFFVFRDSAVVQQNPSIARIANISTEDLTVRATIWGMAFEGVKERPLLGWGQGNFNYVFNKNYDPSLYDQEAWFDRVHNIFFDWLIAGGVLGFVAYFSILFACLYYLFWRPLFHHDALNDDVSFSVIERALLLGILAGYFTHNLVVFDNLVSYMFYAVVLAYIHSRVSTEIPRVAAYRPDPVIVKHIVALTVVVLTVMVIYLVHVPWILAAKDIIDAFQSGEPAERFGAFERALSRHSFADQEITEQMAQQAMNLAASPDVSAETKSKYLAQVEGHIKNLIEQKPNDARLHVFLAGFYRNANRLDDAQQQIDRAHELSPRKQAIILEQGTVAGLRGEYDEMNSQYQEAFELDTDNTLARSLYAISFIPLGDIAMVHEVATGTYFTDLATNNMALSMADRENENELLAELLTERIRVTPDDLQSRVSLAFVYYRTDNIPMAIETLNEARRDVPSFEAQGACIVSNLEAGRQPDLNCQ